VGRDIAINIIHNAGSLNETPVTPQSYFVPPSRKQAP
jgi:hypothetical protein